LAIDSAAAAVSASDNFATLGHRAKESRMFREFMNFRFE
jgi:hypothetical protein